MSCFSVFLLACVDFQVRRPSFLTGPARPPGDYELSGCSYRPFVEMGGTLQLLERVQYGQCGLHRLLWISEAVSCKKGCCRLHGRLNLTFALDE